jgi:hypothetical protein
MTTKNDFALLYIIFIPACIYLYLLMNSYTQAMSLLDGDEWTWGEEYHNSSTIHNVRVNWNYSGIYKQVHYSSSRAGVLRFISV